jgi:hypothetical protein
MAIKTKPMKHQNDVVISGNKMCGMCKQLKLLNDFGNNIRYVDGKQIWCKYCYREYAKNWYAADSGRTRDQIRRTNKTEHSGKVIDGKRLCGRCSQWVDSNYFSNSLCKKCSSEYSHITHRMIKIEFLLAYGKVCRCCRESRLDLLTIEHIRNKGYNLIYAGTTTSLFWKLKSLGWPIGYEILCYNCNMSTRSGKPCSHNTKEYKIYEQKLKLYLINDGRKDIYYKLQHKLEMISKEV